MSAHFRFVVFVWTAVLLAQAGCSKALPDPTSPAPAMKNVGAPPSKAEAQEFADRMTQAVQSRDAAGIDQLVRMEGLAERLVSDLGLSTSQRRGYLKGMSESLKQAGLGQQILHSTEGDGSYKLLRIRTVDGRHRPLFRLIHSDGAINYHEYILARYDDGKVATEDLYIYLSAEPLSQTMRQLIIPTLANQGMGGASKFDSQELDNLKAVGTMGKAVRTGDFKSAIAAYRALPKKSQEKKPILLMYLQTTMGLGPEGEADYLAGLELYRQLYPDDSAVAFISIDYFILKQRYDDARNAIEQLDKAVGGDPYLRMLCGNMWLEAGQFEEARQAIEKAIQEEPDLTAAYWARLTLSLREKNYADTLQWLKNVVEKRHVAISNLNDLPEYAGFAKSPQFGEWQKWYADRDKSKN